MNAVALDLASTIHHQILGFAPTQRDREKLWEKVALHVDDLLAQDKPYCRHCDSEGCRACRQDTHPSLTAAERNK